MGLINFGKITKRQGLSGELRVLPFSKDLDTFNNLKKIYIINPPGSQPAELIIERIRFQKNFAILKLRGIDSADIADSLVKQIVYISEDQFSELGEDEYYWFQLKGLDVYSEADVKIGIVKDLLDNGAQEILVLECDGREVLVPFVEKYIGKTSVKDGRVIVRNLEELT